MMSDLVTLLWLDEHMFVNRLRETLRHPARALLWAAFLAWLTFAFVLRSMNVRSTHPAGGEVPLALAALASSAVLAWYGYQIIQAATRPPGLFAYPADARFIFGSAMSHVVVLFYMQARTAVIGGLRWIVAVVFLVQSTSMSAEQVIGAGLAVALAWLIGFAIRLPVLALARRVGTLLPVVAGWTMVGAGVALGALPIVTAIGAKGDIVRYVAEHGVVFPPGAWIVGATAGDMLSLGALSLGALCTVLVASRVAADLYPEIWDASSKLYALREAVRSRSPSATREALRQMQGSQRPSVVVSSDARSVPAGPWVFVWKEWITFRRATTGGVGSQFAWLTVCVLMGAGIGLIVKTSESPLAFAAGAAVFLFYVLSIFAVQSALTLGEELRKPMWSLTPGRRAKLLAWLTFAALRSGATIGLGVVAYGIVAQSYAIAAYAVPVSAAAAVLMRSVALASYALLPGRTESRGPLAIVRMLATYVLVAPVLIGGAAAGAVARSTVAGLVVAALLGALEVYALLTFTARRIQGNELAFASADAR